MKFKSSFIGNFKVGDNIVYNLSVLKTLYDAKGLVTDESQKSHLIKPKVLIIASICEAILYDFFNVRIKTFTKEGVESLASTVIDYIRGLTGLDEFAKYIDQAKKHDLFNFKGTDGEDFYDALHDLRKSRNRIHIQNTKLYEPKDEAELFSNEELVAAEKILEAMIRHMEVNHKRKEMNYVADFELPWEAHFSPT